MPRLVRCDKTCTTYIDIGETNLFLPTRHLVAALRAVREDSLRLHLVAAHGKLEISYSYVEMYQKSFREMAAFP